MIDKKVKNNWVMNLIIILLIMIVIVPFSSAVYLNNLQITGGAGIPGVRSTLDFTSISVEVLDLGNETNLMGELKFFSPHQSDATPSSCSGNVCVYTSSEGLLQKGKYAVNVNYPGTTTLSGQFSVDGDGPATVRFNLYQEGELVKVDYYVHDAEYLGTNTRSCSGIESIIFYEVGGDEALEGLLTVEVQDESGLPTCEQEEIINLPITTDGTHEVFIKTQDRLGNTKSSTSRTVVTDFTPAIIDDTFKLIKGGEEITYINTESIHSDMTIEFGIIESSDLDRVTGDFSDLNEGGYYTDRTIKPSTNPFDGCWLLNSYNHSWICKTLIDVNLDTTNPLIYITVKDEKGIEVQKSLSSEFSIDNEVPLLKLLGTNLTYDGVSFVNNEHIATPSATPNG